MKLSATDIHNLRTLTVKSTDYKGPQRGMRKLIDAGLVDRTEGEAPAGKSYTVYFYNTTDAGKQAVA